MAADRVDFIDEDDAWCGLFGFVEEIADTACADADEHLDEIRAGDAVERDSSFASHGLGKKGLAGARVADEKDAFWKSRAIFGIFLRVFEVFDHLDHLGFLLIASSDVGEMNLRGVFAAGWGLVEVHGLPVGSVDGAVETAEEE